MPASTAALKLAAMTRTAPLARYLRTDQLLQIVKLAHLKFLMTDRLKTRCISLVNQTSPLHRG